MTLFSASRASKSCEGAVALQVFATIHSMTPQPDSDAVRTFAETYLQMSEAELLQLAASYDSLIESAQDALRAEFARRGMEPPMMEDKGWDEVTSRKLVTVRRYRDVSEAIVARSVVESAGIFCFLRDENLVRLDWQVSNCIGGLSLQVRPEDAEAAVELLSQPVPESIEYESQEKYSQPHCPRCGSINVTFEGADRSMALVTTMMWGLPLPLGGESWRCHACGCRWAEDEEASPAGAGGEA
jgi:hypothetical protein